MENEELTEAEKITVDYASYAGQKTYPFILNSMNQYFDSRDTTLKDIHFVKYHSVFMLELFSSLMLNLVSHLEVNTDEEKLEVLQGFLNAMYRYTKNKITPEQK